MVLDGLYTFIKGWSVHWWRIIFCVSAHDEWHAYPEVIEDCSSVQDVVEDNREEKVNIEENQPILEGIKTFDAKHEEHKDHHTNAD